MYISTGFTTGLFILVILLITPANRLLGQVAIGLGGLAIMGLTLPFRKGVAIAIDYLVDQATKESETADGRRQT